MAGLVRERHLLNAQILPTFGLVVLHNAAGLLLGWLSARAFRVSTRDARAVMIEGGMQNSGLALGIIAVATSATRSRAWAALMPASRRQGSAMVSCAV